MILNEAAEAYFESAKLKVKANKIKDAIQDLTKAIELDPNNPLYYAERGRVRSDYLAPSQKNNQAAYADFNHAITLDPCCAVAYLGRGSLKRSDLFEKDIDGALADWGKAIHCDPNLVEVYEARASFYTLEKRAFPRALADYMEAVRLKPGNRLNYLNRGRVRYRLGDVENGLKDIVMALQMGVELSPSMIWNKSDKIILAELDSIIQANSNLREAYILRGMCYGFLKEPHRAVDDFSRAIELNPDDWLTYLYRAHTHSRLENIEQTLTDLNRSIELNPQQARAYISRGMVFNRMGEIAKAVQDFEFVVEHYPKDIDAHDLKLPKVIAKLKKALEG
ncbi:MAG: tetratricopeptide repeat protein [Chloroflexi bacterium]|nr:tetratricopeptide repeat protein [Chloroflexota bacterium]